MKQLGTGQFHGQTNNTIQFDGITLTDTEYTQSYVDWHYHENAYFTFILQGKVVEGNKKAVYQCTPGSLIFHHWQEAHYNIKPKGYTRGFHLEIEESWFDQSDLHDYAMDGSINISNPGIKILFYQIFKETKLADQDSMIAIQHLILQTISGLQEHQRFVLSHKPLWVNQVREILNDHIQHIPSMAYLVKSLGIHPVHLSRAFPKYFNCTLGEYIRKIRIEKSLSLLPEKKNSLTAIAFECGFSDQSHFTRSFKECNGINPSAYRKILLNE